MNQLLRIFLRSSTSVQVFEKSEWRTVIIQPLEEDTELSCQCIFRFLHEDSVLKSEDGYYVFKYCKENKDIVPHSGFQPHESDRLEIMFSMQNNLNYEYFKKLQIKDVYPGFLWQAVNSGLSSSESVKNIFDGKETREEQIELLSDRKSVAVKWLLEYSRALSHEVLEVEDAAKYKFWEKDKNVDWDEIRKEIADCWHFLISVSSVAGMNSKDVFNFYEEKNKINHSRAEKGGVSTNEKNQSSD
jgi:dimeric dUTPase (all-alpha-NTP-PPase superfamily)